MNSHLECRPVNVNVRRFGEVLWFIKLHEDTAKQVGLPKRNERNERI